MNTVTKNGRKVVFVPTNAALEVARRNNMERNLQASSVVYGNFKFQNKEDEANEYLSKVHQWLRINPSITLFEARCA